jgi:predicted RNA-binding protein associated with RNAse of E/G family
MVEVKRTLDGKIVEYPSQCLLLEPGARAILAYEIEVAEEIAGGRLVLPAGTRGYSYFWFDRPYNVYHWLLGGATFGYYVNIGRVHSVGDGELVWDDYAVDVLVLPDGTVEVLDEDELPETLDPALRKLIAEATSRVLAELEGIVEAVERETRALEQRAQGSDPFGVM